MFTIPDEARRKYPGLSIGILSVRTAANRYLGDRLDSACCALEKELEVRYGSMTRKELAGLPVMKGYVDYYRSFDKTYHLLLQVESVASGKRPVPRVSPLVQAMFMAEMKNHFLTAGHDARLLSGPPGLILAGGEERYEALGGREAGVPAGDLAIADSRGILSTVIHGPDNRTPIGPETVEALFTVYVPFAADSGLVRAHLEDIARFIRLNDEHAETLELQVYS